MEHHVAIAPIGSKDRCGARAVPRRPGADKSVAFPDRSIHVGLSSASPRASPILVGARWWSRGCCPQNREIYMCVAATHMLPCAMLVCVCVIEWSVSGSPAYDVDGITQRVCKTLTEASACTIPRRTGHARTATQIYMALPRKKKSWHARAE